MNITSITLGARISPLFEEWGNVALPVREEILNEIPWLIVSTRKGSFFFDESCILTLDLDEFIQYLSEKKIDFSLDPGQFAMSVSYSIHGIRYNFLFVEKGKHSYTYLHITTPGMCLLNFDGKTLKNVGSSVNAPLNDEDLFVLSEIMIGSRTGP